MYASVARIAHHKIDGMDIRQNPFLVINNVLMTCPREYGNRSFEIIGCYHKDPKTSPQKSPISKTIVKGSSLSLLRTERASVRKLPYLFEIGGKTHFFVLAV